MKLISLLLAVLLTIHSVYADTPYGRMSDFQDSDGINPLVGTLIFIVIIFICAAKEARDEKKSNNK